MNVPNGWRRTDVRISVVLAALTIVVLVVFLGEPSSKWRQIMMIAAWVGWALLPPAYFLIDWSRFDSDDPNELAKLKYSHELASKFWIAGVGVLSGVLLKYLTEE